MLLGQDSHLLMHFFWRELIQFMSKYPGQSNVQVEWPWHISNHSVDRTANIRWNFYGEKINLIHVQISRTVHCPSQVAKACAMLLGQDRHSGWCIFLPRINLIHVQISRTVQRPSQVAKANAMLLDRKGISIHPNVLEALILCLFGGILRIGFVL